MCDVRGYKAVLANANLLAPILRHLAPLDIGRLDRAVPSLHRTEEEEVDSVMNAAARVLLSEMLASGFKDVPLPAAVAKNETPLRRLARLSDLRVAPHDFYCRVQAHSHLGFKEPSWNWEPAAIEKAYAAVGPLCDAALYRLVRTTIDLGGFLTSSGVDGYHHFEADAYSLFLHYVDAALAVCFAPAAPSSRFLAEDITDDESEYEPAATDESEEEEYAESEDEANWTDPDEEQEHLEQEEDFSKDLYPIQVDIGFKTYGTVWRPQGKPIYIKQTDSLLETSRVPQFRCTLTFSSSLPEELPPRGVSLTTWAERLQCRLLLDGRSNHDLSELWDSTSAITNTRASRGLSKSLPHPWFNVKASLPPAVHQNGSRRHLAVLWQLGRGALAQDGKGLDGKSYSRTGMWGGALLRGGKRLPSRHAARRARLPRRRHSKVAWTPPWSHQSNESLQ